MSKSVEKFITRYQQHVCQRQSLNLPPKPLTVNDVRDLITELEITKSISEKNDLYHILKNQVVPGVDESTKLKAEYINSIITDKSYGISKNQAFKMLEYMQGGYNIELAIQYLKNYKQIDVKYHYHIITTISNSILVYDYFNDVIEELERGNYLAKIIMNNWSNEFYKKRNNNNLSEIKLIVFKIPGEITTDDLSPASDVATRPDIPLHARSMLKTQRDGNYPDIIDHVGPLKFMTDLTSKSIVNPQQILFVCDVLGTGSARKSATNSLLWNIGRDISHYPAKRNLGVVAATNIAPIFHNTLRDSGTLILPININQLKTGQELICRPYERIIYDRDNKITYDMNPELVNELEVGGRLNHIMMINLKSKADEILGLNKKQHIDNTKSTQLYSLAQKIVGKACNQFGNKILL